MTKNQALKVLGSAFTTKLNLADVKHIEYRASKNRIVLQDKDYHLGNMFTGIGNNLLNELKITIPQMVDFLVANGATKIKPVRKRSYSIYD